MSLDDRASKQPGITWRPGWASRARRRSAGVMVSSSLDAMEGTAAAGAVLGRPRDGLRGAETEEARRRPAWAGPLVTAACCGWSVADRLEVVGNPVCGHVPPERLA